MCWWPSSANVLRWREVFTKFYRFSASRFSRKCPFYRRSKHSTPNRTYSITLTSSFFSTSNRTGMFRLFALQFGDKVGNSLFLSGGSCLVFVDLAREVVEHFETRIVVSGRCYLAEGSTLILLLNVFREAVDSEVNRLDSSISKPTYHLEGRLERSRTRKQTF